MGPASQFLLPEARVEARELTEKLGSGHWQYEAVSLLHECLKRLDPSVPELPVKVDGRRWFRDFAQLRNKTKGHGAQKSELLSKICPSLQQSLKLFGDNFQLFKREWAYLHRNLSGRYRVTELNDSAHSFIFLKGGSPPGFSNGVYISFGGPDLARVQLVNSTVDADDFLLPIETCII